MRAVGVTKLNAWVAASRRPLTAAVPASMVTSNFVASGNGLAGVKIRMVAPDQRKLPGTAGVMWKKAGRSLAGTVASATIGSEKTTRTSLASAADAISPDGPLRTTRNGARGAGGA